MLVINHILINLIIIFKNTYGIVLKNQKLTFNLVNNGYFYPYKFIENISNIVQCGDKTMEHNSYGFMYYNQTCLIGRFNLPHPNYKKDEPFYKFSSSMTYREGNFFFF